MNWKIVLVLMAELGMIGMALWIPFRMGRAGIKSPWPMLAGWLALTVCCAVFLSIVMQGYRAQDAELIGNVIDGPLVMMLWLAGWFLAWAAGSVGQAVGGKKKK